MKVIGLMTGTSIDGIDAAVVDLSREGDALRVVPIGFADYSLPEDLVEETRAILPPATSEVGTWCRLDFGWGEALAEAATRANSELAGNEASLVVSHGQTVFHDVRDERVAGTLQIGRSAPIAERTGLPVVSDLRSRDVAAAGQGAPLAALFDQLLLAGLIGEQPLAMANLGGIANVTVLSPDRSVLAFDTGPANTLSDLVARTELGELYDVGGRRAGSGRVDDEFLGRLLVDEYLRRLPPKSTGLEHYNATFLNEALHGLDLDTDDILATLTVMAATSLVDAVTPYGVRQMWVSGGGVHNQALWSHLIERGEERGLAVEGSDTIGVDVDGKEALVFAVLGWFTWQGWPANLPETSGASGSRLLGSVTPGDRPLTLPEPTSPPQRLVMSP